MPPAKTSRGPDEYGLLCSAGLAEFLRRELRPCQPQDFRVERLPNHDLVSLRLPAAAVPVLAKLRTVEDVFWLLGPALPLAEPHDLRRLGPRISAPAVQRGLELKNALFHPPKPKHPSFNCFVKQDHDYRVRRHDIADAMRVQMAALYPRWRLADPASVELWGFYREERLRIGLRLSGERLRWHGEAPVERPGALRPPLAAALALAAALQPGERVADPLCGAGGILAEILALDCGAVCLGGDRDAAALAVAEARLQHRQVELQQWDATRLPLPPASLDAIVTNLPFGKQYSSAEANARLYPALLANWLPKLRPGGRLVLLTADTLHLEDSLRQAGCRWQVEGRVKVLGTWAGVYRAWPEGRQGASTASKSTE